MLRNMLLTCALASAITAFGQKVDIRAEEAAIRAILSKDQRRLPQTPDSIFWSGAYPKPRIGEDKVEPLPEADIQQRRNVKSDVQVVRIEVAAAADMAYEFSNFTLSYDRADTKQQTKFTGSVLRVWKKVDGQWKVAAAFLRPHDKRLSPASSR